MPAYLYRCGNQHEQTKFFRMRDYVEAVDCEQCDLAAVRIFTAPAINVSPDIAYDSPIDGTHITTYAARKEDLKRHDCIPYDPEMKKDAARRQAERQAAFDQHIDRTVGETIAKMPSKKKAQLRKEVVNMGMDLEVRRHSV